MIGDELALAENITFFERLYIKLFGVPINGLRIRLRRILPVLNGSPQKVLDAGCGRGVFSYQLARKFPESRVYGVDLDAEQLAVNRKIAEKAGLANLFFREMDVAKLEFKDEFDLVLSVDNLEHVEDDDAALRHLAGALKKGGRLVLHVPGFERRWFVFAFRENFAVPGHFRPGYRLEEICDKVRATGLTLSSAHYTYGFLENLSNNISYAITKAEAKNKFIYALIFPLLNIMSFMGHKSRPKKGAGLLLVASK
ncbi:MAG: methyltransferase domain-containing protein [Desulfobulbaceae bacterium]|nr:methyltransferase domain-containing protein [Desulfobulbaceae bacterium]